MTPEEKEKWRWTFAGQLFCALMPGEEFTFAEARAACLEEADALIAELEKSAVKECEHEFQIRKANINKPCSYKVKPGEDFIGGGFLGVAENIEVYCRFCGVIKG